MHFKKQAQIKAQSKVRFGVLLFDKAFIEVPTKYSNYSNVFLAENIIELLKNIKINKYAIKLEENKQPSFRPIYSLELVELKILKIYIKTNLFIGFI